MAKISEIQMEETIETDLMNAGYFKRDASHYDKSLCLDTEKLLDFIIVTQPEKWEEYRKQLREDARDSLLNRIKSIIDKNGTLKLLRKPVGSHGVYFDLAYFKPSSGMNESHRKKYQNNIFSVMRQVRYSEQNQNSLDMVLFLNGIPLVTMEFKDRMTGSGYRAESAIRQYQDDRDPREPLFKFGRCLVHFALDEELVYMTTHLKGKKTNFLPFNKGDKGNAGNPASEGFSSEYLWKEVLARDSLLDLLQKFIQETDVRDEHGKPTGEKKIIFPRYHQMDAVRKIVDHARKNGTGNQYLIQHSAGSGKSNTISWLAHQLASLHDSNDKNIFDSILVITDRRILDSQLRENILAFEHNPGVVAGIERGSKQLREELQGGTKIIVSTLQKFPYIEEETKNLPGKRFAIILDEAHSSSSGEMSKSVKKVLKQNAEDDPEEEDRTYEDEIDEAIEKSMKARGRQNNVSYFAFTATPKPKTLELFGTPNADGSFSPFHLYTMNQAIQEGFIKNVLNNYVSYETFFHLIKKIERDPIYDEKVANSLLLTYVEMNELTINKKTKIMVDHFISNCINEMNGNAKAMVVCSSRAQAVKYKKAFDQYLSENRIPYKALVAFSGGVTFEDQSNAKQEDHTEAGMNGFAEERTAEKFKEPEYKFLIVANKFQTGFDQPLLYAMYVNKKLQGVNAVQTLSRLNRVYPKKKDPIILDFVNKPTVIQQAFQNFYEGVMLEKETNQDKLYDLKSDLEDFHYYTPEDVEKFSKIYFSKNLPQEKLVPILKPVIENFQNEADKGRKEKFREVLKTYIRVYSFLSQLISFTDIEMEKLYVFGRILLRLLPYDKKRIPLEILQQVDQENTQINSKGKKKMQLKSGEDTIFQPGDENPMGGRKEIPELLSIIIDKINKKYGTPFNGKDKDVAEKLLSRIINEKEMKEEVKNNPKENVWYAFEKKFNEELQKILEENFDFYKKLNDDREIKNEIMQQMFDMIYASMKKTG